MLLRVQRALSHSCAASPQQRDEHFEGVFEKFQIAPVFPDLVGWLVTAGTCSIAAAECQNCQRSVQRTLCHKHSSSSAHGVPVTPSAAAEAAFADAGLSCAPGAAAAGPEAVPAVFAVSSASASIGSACSRGPRAFLAACLASSSSAMSAHQREH